VGRITIKEVAREAGVSLGTVNKALTGKTGISKESKQKVLNAVEKLGYKTNYVAGSLARNAIRIGIIIPSDWEDYYSDICDGIAYEMNRLIDWKVEGVTLKYAVKSNDAEQQALECFKRMNQEGINALIFCHDNYSTYARALEFAAEKNIDVICVGIGLLDKCSNFSTVIEVDAYKCGRIAAELLENFLPDNSNVAVFVGSKGITPHIEKIKGFSDKIVESGKLKLCAAFETEDDDMLSQRMTHELIDKNAIDGIYVATGAVRGVCQAICESGNAGKIKIVATDLSDDCIKNMNNNIICATVYQNTFLQGVMAVNLFYKHFSAGEKFTDIILVPPVLFTKESLLSDGQKGMYASYSTMQNV